MSSKQRAKGSSSTSGVAEDNNQPKRICATCHFELDGTESEMNCPKCNDRIHLDCFRGDGCQCEQ